MIPRDYMRKRGRASTRTSKISFTMTPRARLPKNEIAKYGEYRTARLVLDAWDRIERGELTC